MRGQWANCSITSARGRMKIEVEINQHYALEDAMQAHKDLEAREMTSSSVI